MLFWFTKYFSIVQIGDHYDACVKVHQNESLNTEPCIINCILTVVINNTEPDVTSRIEPSDVNSSEPGVSNGADSDSINSIAPGIIYHTEPDVLNDTKYVVVNYIGSGVINSAVPDVTNSTDPGVINSTDPDVMNCFETDVIYSTDTNGINGTEPDVISTESDENEVGIKLPDPSNSYILRDTSSANGSFVDGAVNNCTDCDVPDESVEDYLYHAKKYRNTNPRNCIIGHLNINSIRNKFDAVECILSEGLADIFSISETKIDDYFPMSQFSVTDFSIHRKDRHRHGGGIMLDVRSNIPHRRRIHFEPEPNKCYGTEMMIIETRLYKTE